MVALADDPGQLARGERMGHGQPHNVWLDMLGETCLDGRPAAGMREGTPIEQAHYMNSDLVRCIGMLSSGSS